MMKECEYTITEPISVSTSGHNVHDWALRFCVFSSLVCSFGCAANSGTFQGHEFSKEAAASFCADNDPHIQGKLISELNLNAEIKERIISKILGFKANLQEGWNGNGELPMEDSSVKNALSAVDAVASEELAEWTVFPSPNGTILFSPTNNLIAGINIGNDEFSYAALGAKGQELKGKELFSIEAFKLAILQINSLNKA